MEKWICSFVVQVLARCTFLAFADGMIGFVLVCPAWANVAFREISSLAPVITSHTIAAFGRPSFTAFFSTALQTKICRGMEQWISSFVGQVFARLAFLAFADGMIAFILVGATRAHRTFGRISSFVRVTTSRTIVQAPPLHQRTSCFVALALHSLISGTQRFSPTADNAFPPLRAPLIVWYSGRWCSRTWWWPDGMG